MNTRGEVLPERLNSVITYHAVRAGILEDGFLIGSTKTKGKTMDVLYKDNNITVFTDDYAGMSQGLFKVQFSSRLKLRGKTFKGETAWSDSARYAEDQLRNAGINFWAEW